MSTTPYSLDSWAASVRADNAAVRAMNHFLIHTKIRLFSYLCADKTNVYETVPRLDGGHLPRPRPRPDHAARHQHRHLRQRRHPRREPGGAARLLRRLRAARIDLLQDPLERVRESHRPQLLRHRRRHPHPLPDRRGFGYLDDERRGPDLHLLRGQDHQPQGVSPVGLRHLRRDLRASPTG